MLNLSDSHG